MTRAPLIQTERLTLRHHTAADFDAYADLWAAPESKFMGGPLNRNAAWGAFCSDVAGWELLGHGAWAIDRSSDDVTVGQVGINRLPNYPERELGWQLYPEHRGRGYATEAARAALEHAFKNFGWPSLVSYVEAENTASVAVARRLGAMVDPDALGPDPTDIVFRHHAPETQK